MKKIKKTELPAASLVIASDSKNWEAILLGLLLLIFECAILYLYLIDFINVVFLILFHIIAVAGTLLYVMYSIKQKDDLRYPLLLLLSIFPTGPFGLAGFIILAIFYPFFALWSTPFVTWFEQLFPKHLAPYAVLFHRIKAGWDDYSNVVEIHQFQDIFNYGTLLQKQSVLDAILKDFKFPYAPILKRALEDPSNMVRIQAAAILAKIDWDFEDKLKKLSTEKETHPQNAHILLELAQHYDQYAAMGVLDPIREKENQEQALYFYHDYLKKESDPTAWFALGRLLFKMGDYEEVITWFDGYQKKFKELPENAYSWVLEALYKQKKYEELILTAKEANETLSKESISEEIRENIKTWVSAQNEVAVGTS